MAALTLRALKGSPLTNNEVDANFTSLDQAKVELAGDIGGSTSSPLVVKLYGRALSSSAPTTGQTLVWDGLRYSPATVSGSGSGGSSIVTSVVTTVLSSTVAVVPAFNAYLDAGQASQTILGNGTQQKVLWNAEEFDTNNNFATSRFTPTVAGYYQLNSVVRIDGGTLGTGENMITIWKNGTEYHRGWNNTGMLLGNSWAAMQVSALVYANGTTDYFEIYVQHGSTSNLVLTRGNNLSYFNGIKIPTDAITAVSGTATVTSNVNIASGASIVNQALKDISSQFDDLTQVFTLRNLSGGVLSGLEYTDSNDLEVILGGRRLEPWIYDTHRWSPWFCEYDAGRRYSFRMRGSKITFYGQPRRENTVFIKINTKSASRQVRTIPFSPNNIAFGD